MWNSATQAPLLSELLAPQRLCVLATWGADRVSLDLMAVDDPGHRTRNAQARQLAEKPEVVPSGG
jgi:membrane protein required for beta-lactamase induction